MNRLFFLILFQAVLFLFSCSDKYRAFKSNYNFKSPDGKPDYSSLSYWAAHPWKADPADSIPAPLRKEMRDSAVDVFFLHPTTYTIKTKLKRTNAAIDDDYINAKTDYSTILYQASVFNQRCRVFAPRYRQAHINAFFSFTKEKADAAFEIAYTDIKEAFEYYLKHYNNDRPIIIAGHSQGAKLAAWLLRDYFENKSLQEKLVSAYVIGWPVYEKQFTAIPVCKDSLQTGCICTWRTFRKGFIPYYVKKDTAKAIVTNPLNWQANAEYADRVVNKGSVLTKFNKIYVATTNAQVSGSVLWVKKPKFPWSFLYFTRNYHVGDINLFYINMRENINNRISAYLNTHPQH